MVEAMIYIYIKQFTLEKQFFSHHKIFLAAFDLPRIQYHILAKNIKFKYLARL